MKIEVETKCRNFGQAPDCVGDVDERYTMDFSDIGEGQLHWCSACGPREKALDEALTKFMLESPENIQKVKDALDQIKCEHKS